MHDRLGQMMSVIGRGEQGAEAAIEGTPPPAPEPVMPEVTAVEGGSIMPPSDSAVSLGGLLPGFEPPGKVSSAGGPSSSRRSSTRASPPTTPPSSSPCGA